MTPESTSSPRKDHSHFSEIEARFRQKSRTFMQLMGITGQVFLVSALSAPFERMKLINQVKPDLASYGYKGLDTNAQIFSRVRSESPLSLFKGTRVIFARNLMFHLFQNTMFNKFRRLGAWLFGADTTGARFVSGFFSSLAITSLCYPYDVLKTHIQCEMGERNNLFFKRIYWSYRAFTNT